MSLSHDAIDRMRKLIGGDDDVLADIMMSFVEEADALCEQILSAAAKDDLAGLGRTAHAIKSSARDFGDIGLAELCAGVELASRQGAVIDPPAAARDIVAACRALQRALSTYVQQELSGAAQ